MLKLFRSEGTYVWDLEMNNQKCQQKKHIKTKKVKGMASPPLPCPLFIYIYVCIYIYIGSDFQFCV